MVIRFFNRLEFLGLPLGAWVEEGGPELAGEGIVIGFVDTGIDPTHPSFSDDISEHVFPVPEHFSDICEVTSDFPSSSCNRKLIGAHHFAASAITRGIFNANQDHASPFDGDGHGSISVYKALYKSFGGFTADVAAAIDQAFIEMGKWENARLMEKNGVEPSLITFNTLLNGFYRDGKFEDGERIWARMEESGIVPDIISYNAKLQGLVNVGKISEAVELVEQLGNNVEKPNLFTYNVLIKWYCNNGNLDEAKSVYDNMLKSDIVPDWFTFKALIPCVCEKGEFGLALKLCEKSIGSNCHVSVGIVQVVVDGLVKESKVEEAKGLMEIAQSKKCYRSKLKMPQEIE